jgi:hypothetical protein
LLHLAKTPTNHTREAPSTLPQWSPPPVGVAVDKVDAGMFSSSSKMAIGVVIRDHNGKFLVACNKLLDQVIAPRQLKHSPSEVQSPRPR